MANSGMKNNFMDTNRLKEMLVEIIKKYKKDKEEEGYVPTLEMLINDLENHG